MRSLLAIFKRRYGRLTQTRLFAKGGLRQVKLTAAAADGRADLFGGSGDLLYGVRLLL